MAISVDPDQTAPSTEQFGWDLHCFFSKLFVPILRILYNSPVVVVFSSWQRVHIRYSRHQFGILH